MKLTYGSLFSGIGGIDLGLDRAGFACQWQVEIDEYCQKVLGKHWPDVARYGDIRDCGKHNLPPVDLIAGGFPCQDISIAGKRAGITGSRSGLWSEFYRIICELRPRYVLVENVPALLNWGIDRVLGDLATSGYDAEWQSISAASIGAPHIRERVFIVAYPACQQSRGVQQRGIQPNAFTGYQNVAYPSSQRRQQESRGASCYEGADERRPSLFNYKFTGHGKSGREGNVADSDRTRLEVGSCFGRDAQQELAAFKRDCSTGTGQWAVEPDVGRVAHGVSHRMDRLRGLGNAVVPQVAEYVGRCILAACEAESAGVA